LNALEEKDAYARAHNNKLPNAPAWMRSDGLGAADWAVVTEYMDVLRPLKECTKRLEGRGGRLKPGEKEPKSIGRFGSIAEIILVFEHLLTVLESRLQGYENVAHDVHPEAPEDHLLINLRAAIVKARDYYNKFDLSLAYYAATILHPRYKTYCDIQWEPAWLVLNNCNFQALWATYKGLLRPRTKPRAIVNNIDDAIDAIIDLGIANSHDNDEFEQ
jgi:hypothetical protein